jgi:hypothetical protein
VVKILLGIWGLLLLIACEQPNSVGTTSAAITLEVPAGEDVRAFSLPQQFAGHPNAQESSVFEAFAASNDDV